MSGLLAMFAWCLQLIAEPQILQHLCPHTGSFCAFQTGVSSIVRDGLDRSRPVPYSDGRSESTPYIEGKYPTRNLWAHSFGSKGSRQGWNEYPGGAWCGYRYGPRCGPLHIQGTHLIVEREVLHLLMLGKFALFIGRHACKVMARDAFRW